MIIAKSPIAADLQSGPIDKTSEILDCSLADTPSGSIIPVSVSFSLGSATNTQSLVGVKFLLRIMEHLHSKPMENYGDGDGKVMVVLDGLVKMTL